MNLHIATPRNTGRRQFKGLSVAIAAAVLVITGATAGAITLRGTSHSTKTGNESVAANHVTTLAGAGRTGTANGVAAASQNQIPVAAGVSYGPNDLDDVPASTQARAQVTTGTTIAASVASQIQGPGPHFIPGSGADGAGAARGTLAPPAAPETPR